MSRSGHHCRLLLKNNNLCEKNVRDLYLLVNECSLEQFRFYNGLGSGLYGP